MTSEKSPWNYINSVIFMSLFSKFKIQICRISRYVLYIKNIQQRYKIVKTDEMHSGKKLMSKMYREAAHNRDMLA